LSEFDNTTQKAMKNATRAMEESMFMIEADTKLLSPVKTGTLKRSYTSAVKVDGDEIVGAVGTNVEYAPYADWRKPHLTAAADQNMEAIKRKFADLLKEG